MQTRRKARQQESADAAALLPHLPSAVQTHILDMLVSRYTEPDPEEYAVLRPHRSSLGWLLSLRKVCSTWDHHLQQHTTLARRIRLEKLRNLSLLHWYAYYMVCRDKSKKQRIKQVPRSICLSFSDGSSTSLDIPRGGIAGVAKQYGHQETQGLPTHGLVLVIDSHSISTAAVLELLADIDTLDKQHATPILLQIRRHDDRGGNSSSKRSTGRSSGHVSAQAHQVVGHGVLSPDGADARQAAVAASSNSSYAALEAAVLPVLSATGPLRNIAKEGDASCVAMTFIPTTNSYCRRVPAS